MKKITSLIISIIFLTFINACAGYKPLYTTNFQFKIADYSIQTNKKLGRQIYSKLYNLSSPNENNADIKNIAISIDITKAKSPTTKDSKGKILEYRITLNSTFIIKDYFSGNEILNQNFSFSSAYKVQNQYSETIKLENKSIANLIDKTFQNLLIKMSENILTK